MLTIIIPTHERHHVLARAIDFYQDFNFNIVIADSSAKKLDIELPDNITYRHYPDLNYVKKILKTAESITTPYICLTADDDYLLESSLCEGLSFLKSNLDFVSVQGIYLQFELIENEVIFSPKYGSQEASYAVEGEDSLSRVVRAYNPYMHQFYSIQHKDIFIKSFRSCAHFSVCHFAELATILVPMCYGKHRVLPILWMARDTYVFYRPDVYQNPGPEKSKHGVISHWYRMSDYLIGEIKSFLASEESRVMKKEFAKNISDLVSSEKESDELFNAAFKSYIKGKKRHRDKILIKLILKIFIPNWVLKKYKKRERIQHTGAIETSSPAKEALEKIRMSIEKFSDIYNQKV
ncbi:MAG: TIGR00180 family glycosyltransferase [Nitrospina sp.]|jgi:glycosyltransferase domain-containing protein|nr:TIGR00180 family glycosyltransferase [Nitrospina sp.]MBT6717667.1 TIGR00180 family glycosyltransferase [Nitrospina sp.]